MLARLSPDFVLERIHALLQSDSQVINRVIGQQAAFKKYKEEYLINQTLDFKEAQVHFNKITRAITEIVDGLVEEDLTESWALLEAVHDRILVYALPETQTEIETVFPSALFPGLEYAQDLTKLPDEQPGLLETEAEPPFWQMVIFSNDHYDKGIRGITDYNALPLSAQEHLKLLEDLVEKTEYPIVYYGNHYWRLDDKTWRKRIHAANSPFALLARTQEMLDFLEKTGRRLES